VVHLRNEGDAPLPAPVVVAYLRRYLDDLPGGSIRLFQIDPGKALMAPGGSGSFTDGSEFRAQGVVEYGLERLGQEASTSNNAKQVNVPQQCRHGGGTTPVGSRPLKPAPLRLHRWVRRR